MALSVGDVKNIVDSKIGGQTLMPATTTIIEGKVVTPQVSSICTLGTGLNELEGMWDKIDAALKDFMNGLDTYVLNPIKDLYNMAKAAVQAALDAIALVLATLDAAVQLACAAVTAALNAASAALTAIFNHVENMVKDGFEQIMAALSFCSPPKVPTVKKYEMKDLASSIGDAAKASMDNLRLQASTVYGILSDSATTNAQKVALLNGVQTNLTNNTTSVNSAVLNDQTNLLKAQTQNAGLNKLTQMANGLNTDSTKEFVTQIMNPAQASLITGVASVMANPVLA